MHFFWPENLNLTCIRFRKLFLFAVRMVDASLYDFAGDPDVDYLVKNGVPDLINDLVATIADKGVFERPNSVHDFCCEWLKSKRSEVITFSLFCIASHHPPIPYL